MNELIWVTLAEYLGGHKLGLSFNDGSRKVFDFSPLIKKFPLYKDIEPTEKFKDFTVTDWTVSWENGEIDIAPEYLYENGVPA